MNWKKKIKKSGPVICRECGRVIYPGNDADGTPNGVGFVLDNGEIYNICKECIINYGKEKINHGKEN